MRASSLLVLLLCLAFPAVALAKGGNDGKAEFEKAMRYYQAQELEAALPWFEKAYRLSKRRPSTIRALAQCERSLKKYEAAIAHFDEYLATEPTPSDAPSVKETVQLLRDLLADRARAKAPPESTPAPPPPEMARSETPKPATAPPPALAPPTAPPPPLTAPAVAPVEAAPTPVGAWALLGGGGAVAVGGGVLFGLGLAAIGTVESAPVGTPFNDLRGDADRAPLFTTLGGIALGLGVASVAGGVVWLLSGDEP